MDLKTKLSILADAAKYDAPCASSGAERRDSSGKAGIGSTEGAGICHLKRLHVPLKAALPFVVLPDHHPTSRTDPADLPTFINSQPQIRLSLFGHAAQYCLVRTH